MAYAEPDDVETALLRKLSSSHRAAAEDLLERASSILRGAVVRLDERLADQTLDRVLVKGVTAAMVARVMRASDPLTRAETIGDTRFEYDVEQLRAELEPTAAEFASLRPKPTRPRTPVGMARTRPVL